MSRLAVTVMTFAAAWRIESANAETDNPGHGVRVFGACAECHSLDRRPRASTETLRPWYRASPPKSGYAAPPFRSRLSMISRRRRDERAGEPVEFVHHKGIAASAIIERGVQLLALID